MTILLDLTVQESFERLGEVLKNPAAQSDRFEIEGRSFHERVREGFLAVARECPSRVVKFSASQPVDVLAEQIWLEVQRRFFG